MTPIRGGRARIWPDSREVPEQIVVCTAVSWRDAAPCRTRAHVDSAGPARAVRRRLLGRLVVARLCEGHRWATPLGAALCALHRCFAGGHVEAPAGTAAGWALPLRAPTGGLRRRGARVRRLVVRAAHHVRARDFGRSLVPDSVGARH